MAGPAAWHEAAGDALRDALRDAADEEDEALRLLRPKSHPNVRIALSRETSLSEHVINARGLVGVTPGRQASSAHELASHRRWLDEAAMTTTALPPQPTTSTILLEEAALSHQSSSYFSSTTSGLKRWWSGRCARRHDAEGRAIDKSGTCNIFPVNNVDRNRRFMQDLFNTLVDCRWRYTLLAFTLGYVVSWLLFALIWYLIAAAHGDLRSADDGKLVAGPAEAEPPPCVVNIRDFTGCFLYSVESQMTIGYGTSYPSQECPEAIFVLCMQSILGLIIQAFTVGMVFAKLTRPKRRSQTLLFSRHAVVGLRDGALCLQFRVADLRKTHMVDARLRAHLLHRRCTAEGERLDTHRTELKLSVDCTDGKLFLIWPLTAVHRIDQGSPLYFVSAQDLLHSKYEILVFLEGTIESTGQVVQARSSYMPSEVLWGRRFEPVVRYDRFLQSYEVDHSRLDQTVRVDAPLCSAHDLDLLVGKA